MNQCLRLLEVVRSICGMLDRQSALHLALTCRALLEPGLDEVWRELRNFHPFVACAPHDAWIEQRVLSRTTPGTYDKIFSLNRPITPADLDRYRVFYAPRIRRFCPFYFTNARRMLSPGTLLALQIVTDHKPGALSPLLREFEWPDPDDFDHMFGEDLGGLLSAYMFLFLGESVEFLSLRCGSEYSFVHNTSVQSALAKFGPRLKTLDTFGDDIALSSVHSFSWAQLTTLRVAFVKTSHIGIIAALPSLISLDVTEVQPDVNPTHHAQPRHASSSPISTVDKRGFPSLRTLSGYSDKLSDVNYFLKHLSSQNHLNSLSWSSYDDIPLVECQEILTNIGQLCSPPALQHLSLEDGITRSSTPRIDEPLDMEPRQIDISAMYVYGGLVELNLCVSQSIQVSPHALSHIPTIWPKLRRLVLSPSFMSSYLPAINHRHLLELCSRSPSLHEVGLLFDGTFISADEEVGSGPSNVTIMRVGESPICSPPRVVAFIRANFPRLAVLDIESRDRNEESSVFKKRWELVKAKLKSTPPGSFVL